MRNLLAAVAAVAILGSAAVQAGDLKSGLELGDRTSAFNVKDVTGPNQGKSLCYRCRYGGRPVVTVFTRELNDKVEALVDELDGVVGDNGDKKMAAFVVLLSEDEDADAPKLTKLAEAKTIENTPLTIFDGAAGPESYKIAKDASVSVMMWVKGEVKVSRAYEAGKLDDAAIKTVVGDTAKILE